MSRGHVVTLSYSEPASDGFQDRSGNQVESFSNVEVTNSTNSFQPLFESAAVIRRGLVLTFSHGLDQRNGGRPSPSAFTVTVGDAARTVNSLNVSGKTVTLVLASAVTHTDTVKVRYTKPGAEGPGKPLRSNIDLHTIEVPTFDDQPVTNNTPDRTAPVFQGAAVDGTQLTLTFDEDLDTGSRPAPGDFFVTVGTARRNVVSGGVAIAGATVTLTLVSAATHTDTTVKVRYTKPSNNPLQDAEGNDVATFSNEPVTNTTDNTPPRLVSASVNGTVLELLFNENFEVTAIRPVAFRVSVNGRDHAIDAVVYHKDTKFALRLDEPVAPGDTVTASYVKPEPGHGLDAHTPMQDAAGNEVESFFNQPVENLTLDETPPALRSTVASGTTLTLTFDEALHPDALPPAASAFTVAGTETPTLVEAVVFPPRDATRVLLTLSQAVLRSQSATVSYTKPTLNPLRDAADNEVAGFENEPVTHPALPPPPSPPPPPPGLHTVPSFVDGDTAQLSIVRRHAERARVGTVAATDADGDTLAYSLAGDDRALFTIDATGLIAVAPSNEAGHRVVFFNPASNLNQVSWLRLVNPGEAPADITISGTDDAGAAGEGPVELTLAAGASRAVTAQALESGEGLRGRLGDGKGKWRLDVSAPPPIRVMSLLSSPTGHLTNLSAAPGRP